MKYVLVALVLIISSLFIFGCLEHNSPVGCTEEAKICPDGSTVVRMPPTCEFALCPNTNSQLANPASTYCIENGGDLNIVDTNEGQVGYCSFPNGKSCEEWAFFRGDCNKDPLLTK